MAAMVLMGASPIAAFAGSDDERENSIEIEDNDKVKQENNAAVFQSQSNSQTVGIVSPQVNQQAASVTQSNDVDDNDVQFVIANQEISEDDCAVLAALVGVNVC